MSERTWTHAMRLSDELAEAREEVRILEELNAAQLIEIRRLQPNYQDAMCNECCEDAGIEHRSGCPVCGKDFL